MFKISKYEIIHVMNYIRFLMFTFGYFLKEIKQALVKPHNLHHNTKVMRYQQ